MLRSRAAGSARRTTIAIVVTPNRPSGQVCASCKAHSTTKSWTHTTNDGRGWGNAATIHLCRACMIREADGLRGLRMLQVMKRLLLDNDYEVEHNAKFEDLSARIDEYSLTYPGEDVEASDMSSLVTELREHLEDEKTRTAQLNRQLVQADERTEMAQRRASAAEEDAGEQRRAAEDAERRVPPPTPGAASTDDAGTAVEALAPPPPTTAEPPPGWAPPVANAATAPEPLTPGEPVYDEPAAVAVPPATQHPEGTTLWQRDQARAEDVPFTARDSADAIDMRRVLHRQAREAGVELSDSTSNGDLAAELSNAVEAAAAAG